VVCLDPTPSDNPSDSDTGRIVPFADDSTEEEQDADCVHSEKFYDFNLSLIAVFKKPPHNRRLSPTCGEMDINHQTHVEYTQDTVFLPSLLSW
jgi:hypothetical protein